MTTQRVRRMVVVAGLALVPTAWAATSLAAITATNILAPAITFTSSNPGGTATATTTIQWSAPDGNKTWDLKVAASAVSFQGCLAQPPASSVTATCTAFNVTPTPNGNGSIQGTGQCSS